MSDGVPEQPLEQTEALLRQRLRRRVWELRVLPCEGGVILQGYALNYYAKQLSLHLAMQEFRLLVVANQIEVRPPPPAPEPVGDPG
jgi:hypothetical protein